MKEKTKKTLAGIVATALFITTHFVLPYVAIQSDRKAKGLEPAKLFGDYKGSAEGRIAYGNNWTCFPETK